MSSHRAIRSSVERWALQADVCSTCAANASAWLASSPRSPALVATASRNDLARDPGRAAGQLDDLPGEGNVVRQQASESDEFPLLKRNGLRVRL